MSWVVRLVIGVVIIVAVVTLALPFLYGFLLQWGFSEQARDSRHRCRKVDPNVVARIEADLTIPGGGSLRDARLEMSEVNPRLGIIKAEVQGAGYEGDHDIGVWSIKEQGDPAASTFEASDPIYAVDGLALQVSTFPASEQYLSTLC